MAIKNSVSTDFISTFVDSINIFHCGLSGVQLLFERVHMFKIMFIDNNYTVSQSYFLALKVPITTSADDKF